MIIKAIELAKLVGCSRQAIGDLKKKQKIFFNENNRFDTLDERNKEYLSLKGIDPATGKKIDVQAEVKNLKQRVKKEKPAPKKNTKKAKAKEINIPTAINQSVGSDFTVLTRLPEAMLNMTLKELAIRHGTTHQLKSYVDTLDKLLSAAKKDVDIQESRKNLLPRSLIQFMFQYLEVFNNQVFDYAKSAADEMISISRADVKAARKKIPEMILRDLSKLVKETKKNIKRELKKFENNVDGGEE